MNEYSVHTDSLGSKSDNSGKKSDVEFSFWLDKSQTYEYYYITSFRDLYELTKNQKLIKIG